MFHQTTKQVLTFLFFRFSSLTECIVWNAHEITCDDLFYSKKDRARLFQHFRTQWSFPVSAVTAAAKKSAKLSTFSCLMESSHGHRRFLDERRQGPLWIPVFYHEQRRCFFR